MDYVEWTDDNVPRTLLSKRIEIFRDDAERHKALDFLKKKNLSSMRIVGKVSLGLQPWDLASGLVIEVADYYCSLLELPAEIKMLSVEIFERFMLCLFDEVVKGHPLDFGDVKSQFKDQWTDVFHKCPIYFIACLQIAAKFESRDLSLVSAEETVVFLKKRGYRTTEDELLEAEMKVFTCMNFEMYFITRYSALEDLISTRRSPEFLQLCYEVFEQAAMLLDMIFRRHKKIFNQVFEQLGIRLTPKERSMVEELNMAEYDAVWASAAAIVAAMRLLPAKLLKPSLAEKLQTQVMRELAEDLSDVRSELELRVFAWVLLNEHIAQN